MPIFKIDKTKASQASLKEGGFRSEAELRDFFAENLEEILGARFLEKECPTTDGRIDTLDYCSFVVKTIESYLLALIDKNVKNGLW